MIPQSHSCDINYSKLHSNAFLCDKLGFCRLVRTIDGASIMSVLYLVVGLIALALFIYLVVALLQPERFG